MNEWRLASQYASVISAIHYVIDFSRVVLADTPETTPWH